MEEFQQNEWDDRVDTDCRAIVRLAVAEDLNEQQDWTTVALVPADREGAAAVVARESGVVAGMPAVRVVVEEMSAQVTAEILVADGDQVSAGQTLLRLQGNVRDLLTLERTLLNLLARMLGIATLASQYVAEVEGTAARVYDTRKTTPGWRRLEKYAAHCGGACNHRMGLYDAVLIKDNHLAQRGSAADDALSAVKDVRSFLKTQLNHALEGMVVQIEVDTLDQLAAVLTAEPDIVLLDNMSVDELRQAVAMRDATAPQVQLEASGGVNLQTLRKTAETGVERISVGALTHSARSLDIGLDWESGE
ncbi:MAG: carboxylating nicotinate-nucleotide diphosphorylase [Bythopirellula sp.]